MVDFSNSIVALKNVVIALNSIEVKGKNNLNAVLVSMQAIEKVAEYLEQVQKGEAHENHDQQG